MTIEPTTSIAVPAQTLPGTVSPAPTPAQLPALGTEKRSFLREQGVLARLAWRGASELSPKVMWKAAYLYAYKGAKAIWSYKRLFFKKNTRVR